MNLSEHKVVYVDNADDWGLPRAMSGKSWLTALSPEPNSIMGWDSYIATNKYTKETYCFSISNVALEAEKVNVGYFLVQYLISLGHPEGGGRFILVERLLA